jgi:universal stress protein A
MSRIHPIVKPKEKHYENANHQESQDHRGFSRTAPNQIHTRSARLLATFKTGARLRGYVCAPVQGSKEPKHSTQRIVMKAIPTKTPGEVRLELNRRDEPLMDAATRTAVKSPFKLKRILVPIDFSDCSKKALQYALPLAREQQAAITLLYVVPPAYGSGEYPAIDYAQFEASLRESGEKQLAKLAVDEVRGEVPGDTLVRAGSPSREIIEVARSLPADLIVISTHGRTGLKHVLLGSVAEHVVQRAPCPVFVVREREHECI